MPGDEVRYDDIARVLSGLVDSGSYPKTTISGHLTSLMEKYVSPNLKSIKTDLTIVGDGQFPLVLEKDSPIILGGGGVVFKASNDSVPGLYYALKTTRPSLLKSPNAHEEGERARLEYVSHAPLSHENIARLFDARSISIPMNDKGLLNITKSPLFVMEWIAGPGGAPPAPLADYIKQYLSTGSALLDVILQCFRALSHLHDRGFVHWDIKSDNFLVGGDGKPKLMDIGNARRLNLVAGAPLDDSIALTTAGKFPPALAQYEVQPAGKRDPNRVSIRLPDSSWDCPWLDLWMLSRELASVLGVDLSSRSSGADDVDPSWAASDPAAPEIPGDSRYLTKTLSSDGETQYALRAIRLILARLMRPGSPDAHPFYNNAKDVIADLEKIAPEFGAAESVLELRSIPRKVIRIPISGNVPLTPRVKAVISRLPTKRLTKHHQLGTIIEVYPGGAHRRFEHSLGVYATAIEYTKALYSDRDSLFWRLTMSSADIEALIFAALLHDIGHLAYGHFLEEMTGLFDGLNHELFAQLVLRGPELWRRRFPSAPLHDVVVESAKGDREALLETLAEFPGAYSADPEGFLVRVADILAGPVSPSSLRSHGQDEAALYDARSILFADRVEQFKFEVLHSILDSASDVDKLDYLRRDAHHVGVDYALGIDVDRLVQSLTTLTHVPRSGEASEASAATPPLTACIAISGKGVLPLESLLVARYQMFQSVYWHHTARSHTAMLQFCVCELLAANPRTASKTLLDLIEEFRRSSDESSIIGLQQRIASSKIKKRLKQILDDACRALLGDRSLAYREGFVLQYKGHPAGMSAKNVISVYDALKARSEKAASHSPELFVTAGQELREQIVAAFAKELPTAVAVSYGEILVDIPPAGRDQVHNLFVVLPDGPHRIEDLSYMAQAMRESFKYWTRPFRLFFSPDLLERCIAAGVTKSRLFELGWTVIADMFSEQGNMNFGQTAGQGGAAVK